MEDIFKMKHKAKRISTGHYVYRGYCVNCVGYYEPERRVCWEAIDIDGCGFAHSYTLRDTKKLIDKEIERCSKL